MNEKQPRFYHADGTTAAAVPATPLTPAAPAATASAATPPAQPAAAATPAASFDVTALAAAIVQGVTGALAPAMAQLSALQPPATAAPPPGGNLTAPVQVALATGQPPAAPPVIYEQSELAEFTKRPGAVFGMLLQQQARSTYALNKWGRFEDPLARCKALYGESHPTTLAMAQQMRGQFDGYNLAGQNSRDASAGGVLVRSAMGDFIAALTERAVIRGSGARVVSNPSGVLEMPGTDGSTSAAYIGEGEPAELSTMTFKKNLLISRKLAGKVAWTWESLNRPAYDLFDIVLNNLLNEMALKEDLAFLRSDGSDGEPVGIFHQIAAANRVNCQSGWAAADANVRIEKAETDRSAMEGKLRDAFLRDDGTATWFMPSLPWRWLDRARTTLGAKGFPETAQGKWGSSPVKTTSLLRSNLGGSGILSEMLYVQMSEVLIADESNVRTETSNAFTIVRNGTRHTAADLDMTVTQVTALHDIGLMRSIAASSTSDCPYR
jgi:HK97 family phage major capsid protein